MPANVVWKGTPCVRYVPPPCPSERRAYGGRKDQMNVLRSRFPYGKVHFYAPAERLRKMIWCLSEVGERYRCSAT